MTTNQNQDRKAPDVSQVGLALQFLGIPVFFALFLFLPAGTVGWEKGWLFVFVFLMYGVGASLYLWRVNPEIYAARGRLRWGPKRWDNILGCFLAPALIAVSPVAALDDGRFHWSAVPWWVVAVGYAMLLVAMGLLTWAEAVNKFFEPSVRIQTDRGHTVIDTGPYAIVRHPGYAAAMFLLPGGALSLGSLWALVPAGIAYLLLVLRTQWEDQTLQAELTGYKEYTERVRFKLLPGVW